MNEIKEYLKNKIEKIENQEDKSLLEKIYLAIEKLENKENLLKEEYLEEIEKSINYLDQKYDNFYELVNLFDPIYVDYKKKIKDKYVQSLREKNRAKRGIKNEL